MSHNTSATVAQTIGIDTGKNTLHLIGLDDKGTIVLREKIARGRIASRFANVPRCLIGIEAGMATHYVARELSALGHDVKQVPPAYAKPFRQGHKNDFRDAYAVAEAVQRPSTRCVPVKTDNQLDLRILDPSGRRNYDKAMEEEANWLGPALLVSDEAAMHIVALGLSIPKASDIYGASEPLVRMRLNVSGAYQRLANRRRYA